MEEIKGILVHDGIDMSTINLPSLRVNIFNIFKVLADKTGDSPVDIDGTLSYYYHNIQISKNKEGICDVQDCSSQKIIGNIQLDGKETILTDYITITNKYLLWLLLQKLLELQIDE